MALTMKEKYARINLAKLPKDFKDQFEGIKSNTENFDPDFVDIEQENFDMLYALTEKNYPQAIKKGGTVKKTKPVTRKKPVAKKKSPTKKTATGLKDASDMDILIDSLNNSMEMYNSRKEFVDYLTKNSNWIKDFLYVVWREYWKLPAKERVTKTDEEWRWWIGDVKESGVFEPKTRGMKKAGYTGEIKKGDVFLWQNPGPNPDPESETEIRGVDKDKGQVSYMESYASVAKSMDIDRFRKGVIKKVSGRTEGSGANDVEECRKILNDAGYTMQKKVGKSGKKAMKVKVKRQERTIIKDKVDDTFKTILKDVSGSKEKDEKYKEVQKALSEMQTLMNKLFNYLNNLAEDNSFDKVEKINAILKKMIP